jgi:hypothetical protein
MSEAIASNNHAPALCVVVVSFNGDKLLEDCLSALVSQADSQLIEIHVISKTGSPDVLPGNGGPTPIYWHEVPRTATIPAMRRLGIEKSNAELLALLEDDCVVGPQWLHAVLAAHRTAHPAIGGPIEPGAYGQGLDWGVFYCEFARFLAPFSGVVNALPGNNVSYKKAAIDQVHTTEGFYEIFFHENLQSAGTELFADNDMVVTNGNAWQFKDCSASPFHHGRAYAAQRFGPRYSARRLLYGLLALLLPIVKTFRTLKEISSRKRKDLPLLKALPWIIVFHSCWSAGELSGYFAGPGDSIGKWQ